MYQIITRISLAVATIALALPFVLFSLSWLHRTAVHEAVIAARDSTKEINEIAKALKDTATQVEETAVAAPEIGKAMRHLTQHINRSAIVTSETVREAPTKVKSKKKS